MRLFEKLRALRAFEKQQLDFLSTVEDHHLIGEIGYHQGKGKPLTLKQLFLLGVGSIATVQRRLRRLKDLGLVQHRRAASDRRAVELTLSPKCIRIFAKYDALMSSKPPARDAARGSGEPSHVWPVRQRCGPPKPPCHVSRPGAEAGGQMPPGRTRRSPKGDPCAVAPSAKGPRTAGRFGGP